MIVIRFAVLILCLVFATSTFAHGGRTNKCGGHNDRKHGGYHVHDYEKYCSCNPDSEECKPEEPVKTETTKAKQSKTK